MKGLMYDTKPQSAALGAVHGYITAKLASQGNDSMDGPADVLHFQVYLVWYAFVLGNWKALVSSTIEDGRYYEVTFNKDKSEMYVDSYIKEDNVCLPVAPPENGV